MYKRYYGGGIVRDAAKGYRSPDGPAFVEMSKALR